jgi:acyl carrier protein phosphodiesterase
MRAGEAKVLTQEVNEESPGRDRRLAPLAVDGNFDADIPRTWHSVSPLFAIYFTV